MRNLFLALLFANLLMGAWHFWGRQHPISVVPRSDGPGIVLADERRIGTRATPTQSMQRVAAPDAQRCVSIGPFPDAGGAAHAVKRLRKEGYKPAQRTVTSNVVVGYWVYLQGAVVQESATKTLATLHANGLPDAYEIPESADDPGPRISLGLFSDNIRARHLRDEVRQLGFKPLIADRLRKKTVYWVDVSRSRPAPADMSIPPAVGKTTVVRQGACAIPVATDAELSSASTH